MSNDTKKSEDLSFLQCLGALVVATILVAVLYIGMTKWITTTHENVVIRTISTSGVIGYKCVKSVNISKIKHGFVYVDEYGEQHYDDAQVSVEKCDSVTTHGNFHYIHRGDFIKVVHREMDNFYFDITYANSYITIFSKYKHLNITYTQDSLDCSMDIVPYKEVSQNMYMYSIEHQQLKGATNININSVIGQIKLNEYEK